MYVKCDKFINFTYYKHHKKTQSNTKRGYSNGIQYQKSKTIKHFFRVSRKVLLKHKCIV